MKDRENRQALGLGRVALSFTDHKSERERERERRRGAERVRVLED